MLGGRGTTNGGGGGSAKVGDGGPPTHRVPGSSVAARAEAAAGNSTWVDVAKRAGPGAVGAHSQASGGAARASTDGNGDCSMLDEDGFQKVTGRKGGKSTSNSADGGERVGTAATVGDELRQDATEGAEARGSADGDKQEGPPTVAELQQAWQDEVAFVKRLRQQGVQGGHPALRAACEARDAAERAWREAKEPAPTSVRLGRAQSKLDRAIHLQAEARRAVQDAEREHRERMATLQAALDECTARVKTRRQQLQEVRDEVATDGAGGAHSAQRDAIRRVHDTLCGEVGPTIAALVDQLDTSTPAWTALNGILGKLSTSKDILEGACGGGRGAQAYDIGDNCDRWDGWSEWSESHDLGGAPPGAGGGEQVTGNEGQWAAGRNCDDWVSGPRDGDEHDQDMDTEEWWDAPPRRWQAGARWQACGYGKWARTSWADQLEAEEQGQQGPCGEEGPPPPARRRGVPSSEGRGAGGDQPQNPHPVEQPQPAQEGQANCCPHWRGRCRA